ncbi:unnamed protein product [Citrullus colocynthis]|uniref:Uncharacterized protein n=1 Tax=Citrullus colocynthis TaxID=252529 RepID=A0ABP0Z002_9ROSI
MNFAYVMGSYHLLKLLSLLSVLFVNIFYVRNENGEIRMIERKFCQPQASTILHCRVLKSGGSMIWHSRAWSEEIKTKVVGEVSQRRGVREDVPYPSASYVAKPGVLNFVSSSHRSFFMEEACVWE